MPVRTEENEKDILETFRKMQVNIPLLDVIKQIPKYAKFLKKLCTTRKWIREKEVVHVSENVSAMLQRKLPPKCKDPDVIKNLAQECSAAPITKDVSRTTNEEGIGVEHKEHVPTLKPSNLAESTPCTSIDCAAISSQHIGEPPIPIPIPISTNRLSPSLVQVPNRIQGGGRVHVDLRKQNTTIRKDHYPFPFKDPKYEVFRGAGCGGNTPPYRGFQ
ncbi:hypothetical protein ACFX2I_024731 [Malus domestica]